MKTLETLIIVVILALATIGATNLLSPEPPVLVNEKVYHIITQRGDTVLARVLLPNEKTGLRRTIWVKVDDPGQVWIDPALVEAIR